MLELVRHTLNVLILYQRKCILDWSILYCEFPFLKQRFVVMQELMDHFQYSADTYATEMW